MGVEAILLRYLVVISGVELFAENISANKPTLNALSVRQRYDRNLIRVFMRIYLKNQRGS
jgi:hypothetical protein